MKTLLFILIFFTPAICTYFLSEFLIKRIKEQTTKSKIVISFIKAIGYSFSIGTGAFGGAFPVPTITLIIGSLTSEHVSLALHHFVLSILIFIHSYADLTPNKNEEKTRTRRST